MHSFFYWVQALHNITSQLKCFCLFFLNSSLCWSRYRYTIRPFNVYALISGCVCILSSIPKAKFDSIKGLPVSNPVWTSYLLISRRACPFQGSPTHQRRFLRGIKKLTSGFNQYLILQITICMMTGPSFYFTLFE